MELIVALVIMSVLLAMGVPRFTLCMEQSRANVAGANLRSIWSAQRLYWLQNRAYAPDLPTLQSANLIDPSLATATAPYAYSVWVSADGSTFTAKATRAGTTSWSGEFTIAADGSFSGSVQQAGQSTTIVPSFQ
jgi:type IV pilus assembly protein PilE